jgi:predicted GIY-YIG superfamily endonuclease
MNNIWTQIYILGLNQGKYYIGKSINPYARIQKHKSGNGAKWTKLWGVQYVHDIMDEKTLNSFDEDIITKQYMKTFGIMNVRGGSYVELNLLEWQLMALQREFDTSEDKCFKCGEDFNFKHKCYSNIYRVRCYYCKSIGHRVFECPIWKMKH